MNEDQLYTAVLALFQTAKRVPHRFAYKLRSGTLTGTGISPLSFCVHEPPDARELHEVMQEVMRVWRGQPRATRSASEEFP